MEPLFVVLDLDTNQYMLYTVESVAGQFLGICIFHSQWHLYFYVFHFGRTFHKIIVQPNSFHYNRTHGNVISIV